MLQWASSSSHWQDGTEVQKKYGKCAINDPPGKVRLAEEARGVPREHESARCVKEAKKAAS
jgi:hypothetical protein